MTTKIHAAVDANGRLVRFIISEGQQAEVLQGAKLIEGLSIRYAVADRGYDANSLIEAIRSMGAEAVIPPRRHRKEQRAYDKAIYTARNLVERLFLKTKNFRRVATRYERLSATYAAMVATAASLLWISD